MKQTNNNVRRGVTLVEIAIVLVIIGLLLGGILKGQELINNAKVRAMADRQNSLKAAWFSFIDRYQALPGDYLAAQQNVPGAGPVTEAAAADGAGGGDGVIVDGESAYVMQHLTGAGYLRCPQCNYAPTPWAEVAPKASNSLQNQYGGVMAVFIDGGAGLSYQHADGATYLDAARSPRLMIHTGNNIPSNIISEVDRKIDDGLPHTGDFRASDYSATGLAPVGACLDSVNTDNDNDPPANYETVADAATMGWRFATVPPEANCGGAVVI